MTPKQILPKRISIVLNPSELDEIKKLSNRAGISPSRCVSRIIRQHISAESQTAKYQFICSGCLRNVNKLYQQDKCRSCLNRDFKRLRNLMNIPIPANRDLRESKGA